MGEWEVGLGEFLPRRSKITAGSKYVTVLGTILGILAVLRASRTIADSAQGSLVLYAEMSRGPCGVRNQSLGTC